MNSNLTSLPWLAFNALEKVQLKGFFSENASPDLQKTIIELIQTDSTFFAMMKKMICDSIEHSKFPENFRKSLLKLTSTNHTRSKTQRNSKNKMFSLTTLPLDCLNEIFHFLDVEELFAKIQLFRCSRLFYSVLWSQSFTNGISCLKLQNSPNFFHNFVAPQCRFHRLKQLHLQNLNGWEVGNIFLNKECQHFWEQLGNQLETLIVLKDRIRSKLQFFQIITSIFCAILRQKMNRNQKKKRQCFQDYSSCSRAGEIRMSKIFLNLGMLCRFIKKFLYCENLFVILILLKQNC